MSTECFPITVLPHVSALYRDYLSLAESAPDAGVRRWFGAEPFGGAWFRSAPSELGARAAALAAALESQSREFGAGDAALRNIAKLRDGARAVVTGQQVGLFGGPLLTLLKAATAVARANEATKATGLEHVPVFWLATEDHDLAEVNQVSLLTKTSVETLHADLRVKAATPVGEIGLGEEMEGVLERATELLSWAPISELLRKFYVPRDGYAPTLGGAFGRLMAAVFAEQGLVVMDAAGREFHALGATSLRYAIEHADELEEALLQRSAELEAAGYHAQVKVATEMSLLFLVSDVDGVRDRQALRRTSDGGWKAGRQAYSTADLLGILGRGTGAAEPECAAAAGVSGHDSADGGVCWRASGGGVLRAECGALRADTGANYACAASANGNPAGAGGGYGDGKR